MFKGEGISKIGLGCVTFGREIDEQSSLKMMDYAWSKGIDFFDTAAAYSNGASETIIGKWLSEHRELESSIILTTKILPPFTAETIEKSVNESLERLGTETIDILYLHRWDTSLETAGSLQALNDLITQGKIQALGASNFTFNQLLDVLELQNKNNFNRFRFVQNNHNLAVSDISIGFKKLCTQSNISIVTYSPLGAGFLTGKHLNGVKAGTRFDLIPGHKEVYFNEAAYARLKKLLEVAERTGYPPWHLALAWALHQSNVASVLIGGRTTAHIDQAIAALAFNDPAIFTSLEET